MHVLLLIIAHTRSSTATRRPRLGQNNDMKGERAKGEGEILCKTAEEGGKQHTHTTTATYMHMCVCVCEGGGFLAYYIAKQVTLYTALGGGVRVRVMWRINSGTS